MSFGLPPGPNVGTQLKVLRRKKAQQARQEKAATQAAAPPTSTELPESASTTSPAPTVAVGPKVCAVNDDTVQRWFESRHWTAFEFQKSVWKAMQAGHSGLLHATTGSGKTLAVWVGALLRLAGLPASRAAATRVMWVTPMRALAADTTRSLNTAMEGLVGVADVAQLTGDTPPAERTRIQRKPPFGLVTTPESLTLMLTREASLPALAKVQVLVVDEWHELVGNKRGVQLQLAIARLVKLNPALQVWGLSATLGNLDDSMRILLRPVNADQGRTLVQGALNKALQIDTLIPDSFEHFPWGGHLGLRQLPAVAAEIE